MITENPDIFTVPEAAAFMRQAKGWIYEHANVLGAVHNGRSVRIPRAGILAYWQRQRDERERAEARARFAQKQDEALDRKVVRIVEGAAR